MSGCGFCNGEAKNKKDSSSKYWPVQQGVGRNQQSAIYQEKTTSANCERGDRSLKGPREIFWNKKKSTVSPLHTNEFHSKSASLSPICS